MPDSDKILSYLKKQQQETGEFRSYCCMPSGDEPNEWQYTGDSPFVTANILYCLRNTHTADSIYLRKKGLAYLNSMREPFGLWRYWKHNNGIMEYNVPPDVDDTSLIAFLLEKNGTDVEFTLDLIHANISSRNRYYTWFLPRYQFLRFPRFFFWLWSELYKSAIVFLPNPKIPNYGPISSPWDSEQGVGAHAVMALGKRAPVSTINRIIDDVQQNLLKLQYYDHKLFVYHHVSRAFTEGVSAFSILESTVLEAIESMGIIRDENDDLYLLNVLNFITLKNFGLEHSSIGHMLYNFLRADPMIAAQTWRPYKYWTSKQRGWWAGSSELTAALYLEAL